MSPDVSVVIPVRNDAERLGACLDALAAQVGGLTVQVIVADNGSSDGSAALANQHPAATTVVVESRRGSYAARNAGIAAADAPVLAFTDADCTPDPDWLVEGLRHLHGVDLAAGAVRMLVPREPSVWAVWDAAHYLNQEAFVADGFGATANLFVRRSTIDAVGPFDPAVTSSSACGRRVTATVWCTRPRRSWRTRPGPPPVSSGACSGASAPAGGRWLHAVSDHGRPAIRSCAPRSAMSSCARANGVCRSVGVAWPPRMLWPWRAVGRAASAAASRCDGRPRVGQPVTVLPWTWPRM
jgi:hypothetical protein